MNTLQQVETSIVLKYFDVNIKTKGTIVTLTLKNEYKIGKDVPVKKLRENGQKVIETGIKYYQHYLGTIGDSVYNIRKKLYSMYSLLNWSLELPISTENKLLIQNRLDEMHINNSEKLLKHYASDVGMETKKKLSDRSKKWANIIGNINATKWKSEEYRKKEMSRRTDTQLYEKSKKTMLHKYKNPTYRNKMLEKANKPERKRKISDAAKSMWKNAKENNIELFRRMVNSCGGKKNFEINGIKMNSIEFLLAQTLNELNIEWKYGEPINIGTQTYIPDFILLDKKIIVECNGDYWHATPRLYEAEDLLRDGIIAGDVWKKDKKRIDDFKSVGYTCLVFWENDITNNLDKIKQQIQYEYRTK
jgi:very-short-patch-repair endonuclease